MKFNQVSTNFLRAVLCVMALGAAAFCVFALPNAWHGGSAEFPMASTSVFLIVIAMYAAAVPFFIALWQAVKLLRYIDQNKAFSELSVTALRTIKYCAITMTVLGWACVPLLFPIADADDAPGLLPIGALIASSPLAVAVFAAVLQKLLQNAMDLKAENELTV